MDDLGFGLYCCESCRDVQLVSQTVALMTHLHGHEPVRKRIDNFNPLVGKSTAVGVRSV